MSTTKLTAKIIDQSVQLTNLPLVIASGSEGVLEIEFKFCPLWAGYGATAVFYRTEDEVYHSQVVGGVAAIPHEVLADEGFFYFGVMGVAENTRTTEVVRVDVKQGAITSATAESSDPTPGIYEQLLAAYGTLEEALLVERGRLDGVIANRGTNGIGEFTVSDEYISGTIKSNGASAYIEIAITDLSLVAGGSHTSDKCIPPEWAPLWLVAMQTTNPDLDVTLQLSITDGWARFRIENPSTSTYTTDMVTHAWAFYPLNNMTIPELNDVRVGHDGEVYATAGEAVRAQIGDVGAALDELHTYAVALAGGES